MKRFSQDIIRDDAEAYRAITSLEVQIVNEEGDDEAVQQHELYPAILYMEGKSPRAIETRTGKKLTDGILRGNLTSSLARVSVDAFRQESAVREMMFEYQQYPDQHDILRQHILSLFDANYNEHCVVGLLYLTGLEQMPASEEARRKAAITIRAARERLHDDVRRFKDTSLGSYMTLGAVVGDPGRDGFDRASIDSLVASERDRLETQQRSGMSVEVSDEQALRVVQARLGREIARIRDMRMRRQV